MQMKMLVTGGTGFVGAYLLWQLLQQEDTTVVATRREGSSIAQVEYVFGLLSASPQQYLGRIEWCEADLTFYSDVLAAMKGIHTVYHCAAIVSFNPARHKEIIDTNILMAQNVVDASLEQGVQRMVHVSSIAALGASETGVVDENTPWTSNKRQSAYAIAKHASEMVAWQGAERGLDVVVVQPSVILGAGTWQEGSPRFFDFIYRGTWFYPGGATGFVDVRDVARAMVLLAQAPQASGQRFLLSGANLDFKALFSLIADSLGRSRPRYKATRPLLWLACVWEWAQARVTRRDPAITPQSVRASGSSVLYDGAKVHQYIPFAYTPIQSTVDFAANAYLKNLDGVRSV